MHAERRRYEHVPFSAELTIVNLADNRRYNGHSIDLCLGGIGFFAEQFLEAGTPVTIIVRLGGPQPRHARPLDATIRWARIETGGAVMGAEFSQVLSPAAHPELYGSLCSLQP